MKAEIGVKNLSGNGVGRMPEKTTAAGCPIAFEPVLESAPDISFQPFRVLRLIFIQRYRITNLVRRPGRFNFHLNFRIFF